MPIEVQKRLRTAFESGDTFLVYDDNVSYAEKQPLAIIPPTLDEDLDTLTGFKKRICEAIADHYCMDMVEIVDAEEFNKVPGSLELKVHMNESGEDAQECYFMLLKTYVY